MHHQRWQPVPICTIVDFHEYIQYTTVYNRSKAIRWLFTSPTWAHLKSFDTKSTFIFLPKSVKPANFPLFFSRPNFHGHTFHRVEVLTSFSHGLLEPICFSWTSWLRISTTDFDVYRHLIAYWLEMFNMSCRNSGESASKAISSAYIGAPQCKSPIFIPKFIFNFFKF